MPKAVTMFVAEDGTPFETEAAAKRHEALCAFEDAYEEDLRYETDRGDFHIEASDLIAWLETHRILVRTFLDRMDEAAP